MRVCVCAGVWQNGGVLYKESIQMIKKLETVLLELVRCCELALLQEVFHQITLIPLELDDFTVLRVVNHAAVASKLFLKGFCDFLQVVILRDAWFRPIEMMTSSDSRRCKSKGEPARTL